MSLCYDQGQVENEEIALIQASFDQLAPVAEEVAARFGAWLSSIRPYYSREQKH
jgi:hypothetical protein